MKGRTRPSAERDDFLVNQHYSNSLKDKVDRACVFVSLYLLPLFSDVSFLNSQSTNCWFKTVGSVYNSDGVD